MKRLLLVLFVSSVAASWAQETVFADGFETGLAAWKCDWAGKQPLLAVQDRAFAGKQSAYSGPPGECRVMRHELRFPLTGRVELRFYDDLAKNKQQIAMVGTGKDGDILAIIVRDGATYDYRVGSTYTATKVPRQEGWRLFAWECDGASTTAFIDGVKVAETKAVPVIRQLAIGSFWNGSTGWYDDVRVLAQPPTQAPPLIEAEHVAREVEAGGKAIECVPKPGASGLAIRNWDAPGQALTWYLGAQAAGPCQLLLKHAGTGVAVRTGTWGTTPLRLEFPDTGGWENWRYLGVPVVANAGANQLALVNESGSRNLDWLALVPADAPAAEYGALIDQWLTGRVRRAASWETTRRAAQAAGIEPGPAPADAAGFATLPPLADLRRLVTEGTTNLDRLREQVLAKESARLASDFGVPPWPLTGPETELSQESYGRLVRYLRLTDPRFHDWPYLAGCRYHKREGSEEWDVRQNAAVALGYATILRGPYDEAAGGVPAARLAGDLAGLLRTVAITHRANFLPTSDGKPWGDQWQSAYWAGIAGEAAWLVWDRLPEDVRLLVARMVEHEANRFNTRPPDSGYLLDTKAEENAWNSEVIALAACMFPHHPNAELWQERAKVYMVNALTRAEDQKSDVVVDGKPLRERVTAVTLHEDFTLENHNRVHPDYLASGGLNLRNALLYRAAGVPLPESMSFHVPETFAVFKEMTATNGSAFYVNGQDWWPHRHDVPLVLAAFSAVLHGDREGAFIERATLDFFGRMHARFRDGSAWASREYNYANAEEEMIMRYSELYLLHRMFGEGPAPVSREEFLKARAGARAFERGGFVYHSTPHKYASFAWRNGVMGLVFVDDDTWLTAPYERGLVGSLQIKDRRDDQPKSLRQTVRTLDDGFAAAAEVSRCAGSVRQWVAMVSLPGRPVLYLERLVAAEEITVEQVRTAVFGVLNEDAPGINPNQRTLYTATGPRVVVGCSDAPASEFALAGDWVNVDNRLGLVASGEGCRYQDENRYRHSRLREVLSAHCQDGVGTVAAGTEFGRDALLILPGATAAETAGQRVSLANADAVLAAKLTDGTVILANLGPDPATGTLHGVAYTLAPLDALVHRP